MRADGIALHHKWHCGGEKKENLRRVRRFAFGILSRATATALYARK
jgi:hypothetical protein